MKRFHVKMILAAGALLALTPFVISQRTVLQKGPLQPRILNRQIPATPLARLRLTLPDQLQTLTDAQGTTYGGARNKVLALDEQGKPTKTFETGIARPSLSPHGSQGILIGDLDKRNLLVLDTKGGGLRPLLDLGDVKMFPTGRMQSQEIFETGEFKSVASDGKFVYVGVGAGFSSSIFKIDPATKKCVDTAFAGTESPEAMAFNNGGLFVLAFDGKQIRRFDENLEPALDHIDLPGSFAKGIGVRNDEIRLLTPDRSQVARVKVPAVQLTRTGIMQSLDKLRLVPVDRLKIKFPPLNFAKRYAVLICGDLAENFAGECFWNDTVWMFKTLLANGYNQDDIIVLYGDGADYISANAAYRHPVKVTDMAATAANVRIVFDGLKNGDAARNIPKMDGNDTLFLWTFDHGGRSGSTSTLGLRGGAMLATEFATKANAITYQRRAVFMQQCYSGGFVDLMKNDKTIISTACRADEVARPADTENEMVGGKSYSHGEFNYHITTALNRLKTTPPGGAINADSNADTYISAREMHNWNVAHESRPETPTGNDAAGVGSILKWKK